jgi:homoserine/homoserine lactone efflux protein
MEAGSFPLFVAVSLLTTFSPGPAVLLALANTVASGAKGAAASSFGNVLGVAVVSVVAMLGVGALLQVSQAMFLVVKGLGAGYLIWLGVSRWRRREGAFEAPDAVAASPRRLFRQGFVVAVTNPKAILFFTALFPQFISASAPVLPQFVVLTSTFLVCSVIAHASWITLARVARRWLANPRHARRFDLACGTAFVGLGLSLLRMGARAA